MEHRQPRPRSPPRRPVMPMEPRPHEPWHRRHDGSPRSNHGMGGSTHGRWIRAMAWWRVCRVRRRDMVEAVGGEREADARLPERPGDGSFEDRCRYTHPRAGDEGGGERQEAVNGGRGRGGVGELIDEHLRMRGCSTTRPEDAPAGVRRDEGRSECWIQAEGRRAGRSGGRGPDLDATEEGRAGCRPASRRQRHRRRLQLADASDLDVPGDASNSDSEDSDADDVERRKRRQLFGDAEAGGADPVRLFGRLRREYYRLGTFHGKPSGCLVYELAHALRKDTNDLLWLPCGALTERAVRQTLRARTPAMDAPAPSSSGAEPSAAAAQPQLVQVPVQGAGAGSAVARACRHHAYSRKQKSLGLLCSNFVALYDREDVEVIGLDDAAKRLGVERRRIYDIVNVLESVGILVRRAKNRYTWLGFGGVPAALKELKERALREMSGSPVLPPMGESSTANLSDDEDDEKMGDADADEDAESEKLSQSVDNTSDKPDAPSCRLRSDHRKEKSLGLLTQNFVKLFLTMELETVSLDEAARLLLGEGHAESNMRTKVRRLYDIANVLSSLNLIEKTQQADTRKPAFRWLGQAKRKQEISVTIAPPPASKAMPNKRAFGTDLTNIENKRGKLDSTVENKGKLMQGAGNIVKTFERQLGQGHRNDFVYGPFHPAGAKKQENDDHTAKQKERKSIQDWENLAVTFRPQYQNQALNDLFGHYVEAWKSWYRDLTRETS